MLKPVQYGDLTEDACAVNIIVEYTLHLLDGNLPSSRDMYCARDLTICSLAKNLYQVVVFTDFPVLKFFQSLVSLRIHVSLCKSIIIIIF